MSAHSGDRELASTQRWALSAEELAASETPMGRLQREPESNQGRIRADKALAFLDGTEELPSGEIVGERPMQTVLLSPGTLPLWIALESPSAAALASHVRLDFAAEMLGGR